MIIIWPALIFAEPLAAGDALPDIILPGAIDRADAEYLGVPVNQPFRITDIEAKIVIIEIFSMYCPYCQREAPKVNLLQRELTGRPDLADKAKIIGIGAGNTKFEVDFFKKKYDVSFPLFPDDSYSVHAAVGKVNTPTFIVVDLKKDGSAKILSSRTGAVEDREKFLNQIAQWTAK